MRTRGGLERMTAFADAVVAIAITLLVLPLVDIPARAAGSSLAHLLSENRTVLGAFFLSFVVIARLWVIHQAMFERVGGYDRVLVQLTLAWLLTIVFLPFPTQLLGQEQGGGTAVLYIGTLLASSLTLTAASAWVDHHPALQKNVDDDGRTYPRRPTSWTTVVLFAVAILVATIPGAGLWALLLLFLAGPADHVLHRLQESRAG